MFGTKFLTLLSVYVYSCNIVHAQYDYGEVIGKSLLFYEAQRTGKLPSNNRIPWRGDSFLNDSGLYGEDLSGGYFDAGDFVKFGFPFASAMTMLAWGMADFKDGYVKAGEWENAKDALKWGTDYMMKIHPEPNVLYLQVGEGQEDHRYWGRPEDWPNKSLRRTLRVKQFLPGSEVAAEQAAAMAAASEVFSNDGETSYASELLRHARELYEFATTYRGKYSETFPEIAEFYNSYSGFGDEFLWSAAWLYRVTRKSLFRDDYIKWWDEFELNYRPQEASWDLKLAQAQSLLAKIDGSQKYKNATMNFCDWVADEAPKTSKGLVFISEWGSLRHISNAVQVCLHTAEAGIRPKTYRILAKQQIDYILGDGGRSYVCGYGNNPPTRPHHASSSCPNRPAPCSWDDFDNPGPNPQVLTGALVGGPTDINDSYEDDRSNFVSNEVALDYNAGFQSALAGLCKLHC